MLDKTWRLIARAMNKVIGPRQPALVCGDCDRSERCGLYPSSQCIARAEQISREDDLFVAKDGARQTY